MQGKLPRGTFCHELLVPLMTLGGTQFLHRFSIHVPHCKTKEVDLSLKNREGLLISPLLLQIQKLAK